MNVRSLCLGILWFDDATGYEINKLAAEGGFSHFIEASYGSIYPALNKLTEEGLVTWREETQPGKPARKVYSITEEGRAAHLQSLYEGPKPDIFKSEFLFLCLYSNFLDGGFMRRITDAQIAQIEEGLERLHDASAKCDHPESCFAIGYGKALHEAALGYLKENRNLIEGGADAKPQAAE